eukprot:5328078-Ditylum_brightwellii.AAC.1
MSTTDLLAGLRPTNIKIAWQDMMVTLTTKAWGDAKTPGVYICNCVGPKHGALHYLFGPGCTEDMHYHSTMGEVPVLNVTHGSKLCS